MIDTMPRRRRPPRRIPRPRRCARPARSILAPTPSRTRPSGAQEFFDRRDRVQVKYEMLRRHRVDGRPVTDVATAFGVSRQTFYRRGGRLHHGRAARAASPLRAGRSAPTSAPTRSWTSSSAGAPRTRRDRRPAGRRPSRRASASRSIRARSCGRWRGGKKTAPLATGRRRMSRPWLMPASVARPVRSLASRGAGGRPVSAARAMGWRCS